MFTLPLRSPAEYLTDRYSERNERMSKDIVPLHVALQGRQGR
jgi:hypothetical protein